MCQGHRQRLDAKRRVWATTVRKECLWRPKKTARVGLWKRRQAEKSKNRLSRLAWKSRKMRGDSHFATASTAEGH